MSKIKLCAPATVVARRLVLACSAVCVRAYCDQQQVFWENLQNYSQNVLVFSRTPLSRAPTRSAVSIGFNRAQIRFTQHCSTKRYKTSELAESLYPSNANDYKSDRELLCLEHNQILYIVPSLNDAVPQNRGVHIYLHED